MLIRRWACCHYEKGFSIFDSEIEAIDYAGQTGVGQNVLYIVLDVK